MSHTFPSGDADGGGAPDAARAHSLEALLVIAHPDDECMFFVPTVVSLQQAGHRVFVLCTSTGDFDGLGSVRQRELFASCAALGIAESDVRVLDVPDLQDGMANKWPATVVAQATEDFVAEHPDIDKIITFDEGGVSGHPNHIAVFRGVEKYAAAARIPLFKLESTNIFRKYVGPLDALWSAATSYMVPGAMLTVNANPLVVHRAMVAHWSQYVWFRRLFVVFSRYSTLNTLVPADHFTRRAVESATASAAHA